MTNLDSRIAKHQLQLQTNNENTSIKNQDKMMTMINNPSNKFVNYEELLRNKHIWNGNGYSKVRVGDIVFRRSGSIHETKYKVINLLQKNSLKIQIQSMKSNTKYVVHVSGVRIGDTIDLCLKVGDIWRPAYMSEEVIVDVDYCAHLNVSMSNSTMEMSRRIKKKEIPLQTEIGYIKGIVKKNNSREIYARVTFNGGLGEHVLPVYWLKPKLMQLKVQDCANYICLSLTNKDNTNNNNKNTNKKQSLLSLPDINEKMEQADGGCTANDSNDESVELEETDEKMVSVRVNISNNSRCKLSTGDCVYVFDKFGKCAAYSIQNIFEQDILICSVANGEAKFISPKAVIAEAPTHGMCLD